jgi:hypothetical protein
MTGRFNSDQATAVINESPKSYKWAKSADEILTPVKPLRQRRISRDFSFILSEN